MNKGQYYKEKTKRWLSKQGYHTEYAETVRAIRRGNVTIYQKKDLLGGDVIGVNDTETILANAVLGKSNLAKHRQAFKKYPRGNMKRIIVIWQKGWRTPLIREVDDGV